MNVIMWKVEGRLSLTDFVVPVLSHCAWPACSGHLWLPPPPEAAAAVAEADGLSYSHYYDQRISLARLINSPEPVENPKLAVFGILFS